MSWLLEGHVHPFPKHRLNSGLVHGIVLPSSSVTGTMMRSLRPFPFMIASMLLAPAVMAGEGRFSARSAEPAREPPSMLRPTSAPLIRSASAYPDYQWTCPKGVLCTVCIAGCLPGRPHVLQGKPLPLVSTQPVETSDETVERDMASNRVKPAWAEISCGVDGCVGRGAPMRRYDPHISVTIMHR